MHTHNNAKSILVFLISLLLLASAASADRGRGGLGKLVGLGVGAVTGHVAEKKLEEAMSKDTYTGEGFVITEQGLLLRLDDGDVFLSINNPQDAIVLTNLIKTTNRIEVTKIAEWGDIHGNVAICENDTICSTLIIDVVKEKTLSVKFMMYNNPEETYDLILYEAEEPGVLDYIWNFIINNILWVAIVVFGALGGLWDYYRKRRRQQVPVEEASEAPEENQNNEQ
jgi:hypothetical protein